MVVAARPSSSVARRAAWPLAAWTLFVWVSRVRNVVQADHDTWGTAWRLIVAALFVSLAAVTAAWIMRGRPGWALAALSVWSLGFWLVRGGGILLDPAHDAGFKAIHTVLWAVTVALVVVAWRARRMVRS